MIIYPLWLTKSGKPDNEGVEYWADEDQMVKEHGAYDIPDALTLWKDGLCFDVIQGAGVQDFINTATRQHEDERRHERGA